MKKQIIINLSISIVIGTIFSIIAIKGSYAATTYAINSNAVEYTDNSSLGVTNVQAAIDGTCTKINTRLSDLEDNNFLNSHPVNSIYLTVSEEENTPEKVAKLYGGTWEKFGEGKTLVGEGTGTDENGTNQTFSVSNNYSNLGEYKHVLTINEMPSHTHQQVLYTTTVNNNGGDITQNAVEANLGWFTTTIGSPTGHTKSTGDDESHNNIQPYITVYMYRRIA